MDLSLQGLDRNREKLSRPFLISVLNFYPEQLPNKVSSFVNASPRSVKITCARDDRNARVIKQNRVSEVKCGYRQDDKFKAEPLTERYSQTYFNNRKREWRIADVRSSYDRSHDVAPFDPSKPRCDRARRSLIWAEIHEENKRHVVPMTVNHWYGRPNRIQIDYPDMKFARSSKTKDFYSRGRLDLTHETKCGVR